MAVHTISPDTPVATMPPIISTAEIRARAAELLDELLPPFASDAACLEHPELEFFPERRRGLDPMPMMKAAKAVCAGCLVRSDCRQYAIDQAIDHGVWGGDSAVVRVAERRDAAWREREGIKAKPRRR